LRTAAGYDGALITDIDALSMPLGTVIIPSKFNHEYDCLLGFWLPWSLITNILRKYCGAPDRIVNSMT
jgi:hypothetical protein